MFLEFPHGSRSIDGYSKSATLGEGELTGRKVLGGRVNGPYRKAA